MSKRSVISGRICSAACGFVSSMEVEGSWMAWSRQIKAEAGIADGIVPPGVSRTMIFGIASPKIVLAKLWLIPTLLAISLMASQPSVCSTSSPERGTGSGPSSQEATSTANPATLNLFRKPSIPPGCPEIRSSISRTSRLALGPRQIASRFLQRVCQRSPSYLISVSTIVGSPRACCHRTPILFRNTCRNTNEVQYDFVDIISLEADVIITTVGDNKQ